MAELVFTTRPHIHRPYMNGMYFKQNGKTYKIISGGYDTRGDIVKFEEIIKNGKGTVYSVPEKEFFGKIDKSDLKSTL